MSTFVHGDQIFWWNTYVHCITSANLDWYSNFI